MLPRIAPTFRPSLLFLFLSATLFALPASAAPKETLSLDAAVDQARTELTTRHGASEGPRIERGLQQARAFWQDEDGSGNVFLDFVLKNYAPQGPALDALFDRLEFAEERIEGYMTSLGRDLRSGSDLDVGPRLPVDDILAGYDPAAHLSADSFDSKLAFVALLNFPQATLEEKLQKGPTWSRRQWAEVRLAERFAQRIPAAAAQGVTEAMAAADAYISSYNIYMHHVTTTDGERPFPKGMRLLSHWNLRDQIKADYAEKDGLVRQRLIATVMERIVRQEIPKAVVDNPLLDWTPETNDVLISSVIDDNAPVGAQAVATDAREPDDRYKMWIGVFKAEQGVDAYERELKTHVDRMFAREREIPEADVRRLAEQILSAPLGAEVGQLISKRLGRPLESFDIWYAGFRPRAQYPEAQLSEMTKKKYPTAQAFAADMPRILTALGFSAEKAQYLADRIVVEPARGSGHASGAARRDDKAHLRTRVGADGMDYKGYNIAVHEFGHNCEQVFSTSEIDHTLLRGVPNTAFTEALAFMFQERDLELLGLPAPDEKARQLLTLDQFWAAREIAGVALVDIDAWRWLYDHPNAKPSEFREAVVGIAQNVWNKYFAPAMGVKDSPILAVYSHLIDAGLYTPDYLIGQLIQFQLTESFRKAGPDKFGAEFERVATFGRLTPDLWQRKAAGGPIAAEPLLDAAAAALKSASAAN